MKQLVSVVFGLVAVAGTSAWATHDEPKKGKTVKATMVTSYEACTEPNTMTKGSTPVPACAPPVRSDPECGFRGAFFNAGFGKFRGSTTPQGDMRLSLSLKNLSSGCEGTKLCSVVDVRVTTDRCEAGACTLTDLLDFTSNSVTGCCIVEGGSCKIRTTVNSEFIGILEQGERTGIEILGCGLKRVSGPGVPVRRTFSCGPMAP